MMFCVSVRYVYYRRDIYNVAQITIFCKGYLAIICQNLSTAFDKTKRSAKEERCVSAVFDDRQQLQQVADHIIAPVVGVFRLAVVAGGDPGVAPALHVGAEAVADQNGAAAQLVADDGKDAVEENLLRLAAAELLGDENAVEQMRKAGTRDARLLRKGVTVGDDVDPAFSVQRLEKLTAVRHKGVSFGQIQEIIMVERLRIDVQSPFGKVEPEALGENERLRDLAALECPPEPVIVDLVGRHVLPCEGNVPARKGPFQRLKGALPEIKKRIVNIDQNNVVAHDSLPKIFFSIIAEAML